MTVERTPTELDGVSLLLRCCLYSGAAIYPVIYFAVAVSRIRYPFELEWIEGVSLGQVRWILSGQQLYGPPSVEFIPLFYAPLYYYVSAAVAQLLGPGFVPLRLVSFVASLGCFSLIFAMVRRETGSLASGLLAVGLFAATFRLSGAWFDLARIDMLFLFFLLLGLYLARFSSSGRGHFAAATALALAVATKQTAVFAAVVLSAYYVCWNRRHAVAFVGSLTALVVGSFAALQALYHGWFGYYVFGLSHAHNIVKRSLVLFWTRDLFAPLGIALVLATFWLGSESLSQRSAHRFYAATAVALVGTALGSRMNPGGYDNVLIPAHAMLSILYGLAVHRLLGIIRSSAPAEGRCSLECLLSLACLVQFCGLAYNPMTQVPTGKDLMAGRALLGRIREIKGEVFVPGHPYLAALAGKKTHAGIVVLYEILAHTTGEVSSRLMEDVRQAIRERRFGAVILDSRAWFRGIDSCYSEDGRVFEDDTVFWPVTGAKLRPEHLYLPREDGPCELPYDLTGRRGDFLAR